MKLDPEFDRVNVIDRARRVNAVRRTISTPAPKPWAGSPMGDPPTTAVALDAAVDIGRD